MITIKETSKDFDKVAIYRMTLDNNITSCKDLPDGTEIEVDGYIEFIDTKDDGKEQTVFSIMATDGKVYACTSQTFARNIRDIAEIYEGKPFTVVKSSGVTKAGKDFILASLKY